MSWLSIEDDTRPNSPLDTKLAPKGDDSIGMSSSMAIGSCNPTDATLLGSRPVAVSMDIKEEVGKDASLVDTAGWCRLITWKETSPGAKMST